jgi:hypothetical protein
MEMFSRPLFMQAPFLPEHGWDAEVHAWSHKENAMIFVSR